MSKVVESKARVSGRKHVTSQLLRTPFGDLKVEIGIRGYKSSEGDKVYDPPTDTNELDGAEEQALESE